MRDATRAGARESYRRPQWLKVLEAVAAGCETSSMCAAFTGLPLRHASAHLSALASDDYIRLTHRRHFEHVGRYFRDFNRYEIAEAGALAIRSPGAALGPPREGQS
jgi:hypothetical protein